MDNRQLRRERWVLLHNIIRTAEPLMAGLAAVWMVLLVIDFTRGLTPALSTANHAIWLVFAIEFIAELLVAPSKTQYLKRHWLVAVSLLLPILRVARLARVVRIARAARGARLVRAIGSFNRGMAALRATMRRRGIGYVAALTALTTIAGAAAMYAFEHDVADPSGIHGFGTALWWTAMIMTTMGSAYWPQTAEGRIVCVLLALYAFAMFGYVTATLSSFFVDRDASRDDAALAGQRSLDALANQIAELRAVVETQSQRRLPRGDERQRPRRCDSISSAKLEIVATSRWVRPVSPIPPHRIVAVHVAQSDVAHQDVGLTFGQSSERLCGRVHGGHAGSRGRQEPFEEFTGIGSIFDHEYANSRDVADDLRSRDYRTRRVMNRRNRQGDVNRASSFGESSFERIASSHASTIAVRYASCAVQFHFIHGDGCMTRRSIGRRPM